MPRLGVLLALSREHHGALVMARDARRAAAVDNSAVWMDTIARIEDYGRESMAEHFAEEERLLQLAGEKIDAKAVARFLSEHAELRQLAGSSCSLEPRARLSRFGELLGAHVRYEERVFFPQLEPHMHLSDLPHLPHLLPANAISTESSPLDPASPPTTSPNIQKGDIT